MTEQESRGRSGAPPDVSVIIVSYNTRDVTAACVRSIYERTSDCTFEVIVVDNASKDGSAELISRDFPSAIVIANSENKGFAAANNQGLRVAHGRFLLVLNPDTEVNEGTIARSLAFAEQNAGVGVIGCRVLGPDGEQESTLFRYLRLRDVLINVLVPNRMMLKTKLLGRARYPGIDLDREQDVEVVAGCFMFIPREAFEQVGEMDEGFFMYGEEAEWCYRFASAGWSVRYFPGASILHYGGVSTAQCPTEMTLAMARSQLLLLQRTRGRLVAFVANLLMLLRDLPRATAWQIVSRVSVPKNRTLRLVLKRSAKRCALHARGLVKLDWSA